MRKSEQRSRAFAKRLRNNLTNAETILWSRLRRGGLNGQKFRRQHPIGPYIVDFACIQARLVVEVDGATHSTPDEVAYDRRRTRFLRKHGWFVYRATNPDIYENLNGVLEGIAAHLPPPPLRGPPPP
ncbi:DUF559 domain-containing protein [Hyphobacterium sp. HN65]|uniref:DUF559 domain-containing protein n=1 Tax=Hyphobacterium lacteum TaxID=3116575 RepID=A0ABU7LNC3_9PROT|nr:DUF559 domain-containing protein [Hyphobacterium sp. HN65]MEE2525397.1 DUF559 domain-containing protein [Hyphobacterium sp. HN65]